MKNPQVNAYLSEKQAYTICQGICPRALSNYLFIPYFFDPGSIPFMVVIRPGLDAVGFAAVGGLGTEAGAEVFFVPT